MFGKEIVNVYWNFFLTHKSYSLIQIDKVHRYNINLKSPKINVSWNLKSWKRVTSFEDKLFLSKKCAYN
jgi:hypothetical protein